MVFEQAKGEERKSEKCEKLEETSRDTPLFNGAETERQVNCSAGGFAFFQDDL